ncbi:MAG: dethiobiotin synthase [Pseudomonadota bacterium]
MRGWFVTGTDTGVGKTRASVALLHALRRQGVAAVGMKPVAAGTDAAGRNEDVDALRAASALQVEASLANPYLLPDPVSPHIAARNAGQTIDIGLLQQRCQALARRAQAVVVEGAGGFHVPLDDTRTGADLAGALGLPVVLVVGLRLGCLNHALLTQEAIAARGLRLAGWVANLLDPAMPEREANLAYLRQRLAAPLLAAWPWDPQADAATLTLQLPLSADA